MTEKFYSLKSNFFELKIEYLNLNSGVVGLMLIYLCQLIGLFQWTIRQSCEVENLVKIKYTLSIFNYFCRITVTCLL